MSNDPKAQAHGQEKLNPTDLAPQDRRQESGRKLRIPACPAREHNGACRHPGHGAVRAVRAVRAAGFRPGSRPGRRALEGRENCDSRHALPRARLRTGAAAPGSGWVLSRVFVPRKPASLRPDGAPGGGRAVRWGCGALRGAASPGAGRWLR